MAGSITPTNQFAAQSGPIPLSQLDTNFTQSATALNSLTTFNNYYQDTGTTNAWVITVNSPQIVAYSAGLNVAVKVANSVTGACTINVNGLGAKNVTNPDTTAIVSGQIVAGAVVELNYDGTQFQVNGGTQGSPGNVPTSRQILTTSPLTGGGDLTANRTLAVNTFGAAQAGVVPSSGGGTVNFLRADGTWSQPSGTGGTVTSITFSSPLTGGTISGSGTVGISNFASGSSGTVPASGGATNNFLRADGTWTNVLTSSSGPPMKLSDAGGNGPYNAGFLEVPQTTTATGYTAILSDSGKHILVSTNSQTLTIPANSSVAFPVGTTLTFVTLTATGTVIAINTDTMYWSPTGATGSRNLSSYGRATALKVGSNIWIISGTGLT